jgi:hypothetical protein
MGMLDSHRDALARLLVEHPIIRCLVDIAQSEAVQLRHHLLGPGEGHVVHDGRPELR